MIILMARVVMEFSIYIASVSHFRSVQSFSHVWPFTTPWTAAHQASPEHAQTHVHWVGAAIQHVILCHPLLLLPSIFPSTRVFSYKSVMSRLFAGGQSIGTSASASVPPNNVQNWFSLGLTCLVSLQSKGLSRVFSNTIVEKYQLFSSQLSLWSNSHIHAWLLEKP